MAEWLFNHLVPILVCIVVVIYTMAWRTLAPRSKVEQLRDCVKFGPETQTDYYDQVSNCDPYNDHRWAPAPQPVKELYPAPTPYISGMAFNGTCAADFSIPNRDPWKHDKVKTVAEYDAESSIETSECCATSYTELMGRLRTGTLQPADMPSKLPVTFDMLLSLVMAMIDTHERKGDAKVCDDVFTLLRRRYDATSLNSVPEARYLELWVDLKQLERNRG